MGALRWWLLVRGQTERGRRAEVPLPSRDALAAVARFLAALGACRRAPPEGRPPLPARARGSGLQRDDVPDDVTAGAMMLPPPRTWLASVVMGKPLNACHQPPVRRAPSAPTGHAAHTETGANARRAPAPETRAPAHGLLDWTAQPLGAVACPWPCEPPFRHAPLVICSLPFRLRIGPLPAEPCNPQPMHAPRRAAAGGRRVRGRVAAPIASRRATTCLIRMVMQRACRDPPIQSPRCNGYAEGV